MFAHRLKVSISQSLTEPAPSPSKLPSHRICDNRFRVSLSPWPRHAGPTKTFFADLFVQEHVRLDAVVCLCDSPRLVRTLMAPPPPPPTTTEDKGDAKSSTPVEESGEEGATDSSAAAAATLVKSQLALSDRVLLNKSDLISPAQVSRSHKAAVDFSARTKRGGQLFIN